VPGVVVISDCDHDTIDPGRAVLDGHGVELRRLATLTWGVVGCGAIGSATASRAAGLGMRVLGYDIPQVRSEPPIERVPLEALLEAADVVSLHAALTPESHHLIGAAALARMRPTAFLVNTARGGLVDAAALLAALDAGALAGAALDVLEGEPPDELGWRLVRPPGWWPPRTPPGTRRRPSTP
jgi:phosphoglycerate dehydrogenase-like enzyme